MEVLNLDEVALLVYFSLFYGLGLLVGRETLQGFLHDFELASFVEVTLSLLHFLSSGAHLNFFFARLDFLGGLKDGHRTLLHLGNKCRELLRLRLLLLSLLSLLLMSFVSCLLLSDLLLLILGVCLDLLWLLPSNFLLGRSLRIVLASQVSVLGSIE